MNIKRETAKKNLTLIIVLAVIAGLASVAKSSVIDTVTNDYATSYSKDRHVAMASNGTIAVLYYDGEIRAKKSTDYGATWTNLAGGAGFTVIEGGGSVGRDFSICADAEDNIYVAYQKDDHIYFKKLTYSVSDKSWTPGSRKVVEENQLAGKPSIIREDTGKIWVAYGYSNLASFTAQVKVRFSTNEFQTNGTETVVFSESGSSGHMYYGPVLVIRNGNPLLIYEDDIYLRFRWSYWTGSSWSIPAIIPAATPKWLDFAFSVAMIGNDVHLVYNNGASFSILHTYYNGTWQPAQTLSSSVWDRDPNLTASNGELWCFISQYGSASSWNIAYKKWSSGTWDAGWTPITSDTYNVYPTILANSPDYVSIAWTARDPGLKVKFHGIDCGPPPAPENVDDGVAGWSSDDTPTFTWDAVQDPSGIDRYWWAVDNPGPETGGFWTTERTATTAPLSDGIHTFYVKAQDGAGFIGPAGSHECWIDATAPGAPTNVDDGVAGWSSDDTPTFTWDSMNDTSGIDGYWWAVDDPTPETGGVWTTETTATTASLSDGVHTFYVKAQNGSGLIGPAGSHVCQIDATAPGAPTNVDDGVAGWSSDDTPTFTWDSVDDTSGIDGYWWAVDDATPETGGFWTTETIATTARLSDGVHTFYVKAQNGSGLIGPAGSHVCQIDATAPGAPTNVDDGVAGWSSDDTPTFTWDSVNDTSGIDGYWWAVDDATPETGGVWTTETTATTAPLSDGMHTFYVKAQNGSGLIGPAGNHVCQIDATAPGAPTNVDDGVAGWSSDDTPTFTWDSVNDTSGIDGYWWAVDDPTSETGGVWTTETTATTAPLSNGVHTFYVKAQNGSGLIGPAGSHECQIDATAPGAPTNVDDGVAGWSSDDTPTFTWDSPGDPSRIDGYWWAVDDPTPETGGVWTTETTATTAQLSDGMHTFYVKAQNGSGLIGPAGSHVCQIDATAPGAPTNVDDGVDGWSSDDTPTFTWDSVDDTSGIDGYWWAVDDATPETGGVWTTETTATTAQLSDGMHTFYVKARNGSGLIGPAGRHVCQIDATAPGAPTNVDDGVDGWSSDDTPTFTWDSVDDTSGIDGYWWAVDDATPETGGVWTTETTATTAPLSNGAHTFYVKARNGSGLIGPAGSHVCQIETMPPLAYQITSSVDSATTTEWFKLTIELINTRTGIRKGDANNKFILAACTVSGEDAPGKWIWTGGDLVLNSGWAEVKVSYDTVGMIRFKVSDDLGHPPGYTDPIDIRPVGLRYDLEAPGKVKAGKQFPLTIRLIDTGVGNLVTPKEYARQVKLAAYSSPDGNPAEGELKMKSFYLQGGETVLSQSYNLAHVIYIEASDAKEYTPQSTPGRTGDIEVIGAPKTVLKLDGAYNEIDAALYVTLTTRVIIESISDIVAEKILYRDNESDWTTYVGPFTLSPGRHVIEYYGIDKYGNEEEINRSKPIYVSSFGGDGVSNRPNPFKAGKENTWIEYNLKEPSNVIITIHDLFGQEVWRESYAAGENGGRKSNSVVWDGKNLSGKVVANGGYICRVWIEKEKRHMTRKIAVAK